MKKSQLNTLLTEINNYHRIREDILKSRIRIEHQARVIKKRIASSNIDNEFTEDMLTQIKNTKTFHPILKYYEKELERTIKKIPLFDWFIAINGCGPLSYASLMAEIGNPHNYENPAKVWRRMGLAVFNGRSDKNREKGNNTGYSKRRRMIAYRISSAIIKQEGKYRKIYLKRKDYEINRDAEGYNAEYIELNGGQKKMKQFYSSPQNKKRIENNQLPLCILDLRAHRYMIKRLLKDIWYKWNTDVILKPD